LALQPLVFTARRRSVIVRAGVVTGIPRLVVIAAAVNVRER
jgi:hypothetical protein